MINAIRTLLMNRTVDGKPADFPGEEFIDPQFQPKRWPAWLSLAMRFFTGSDPDRLYLNYRMRQLMELLHSTELSQNIYLLDARVTYWPFTDIRFFEQVFGQQVEQIAGDARSLTINGTHDADEGVGRTTAQWQVTVLNSSRIQVDRLTPPVLYNNVIDYGQNNGLSDYVSLPGSRLNFKFPTAGASGCTWTITSRARPEQDLSQRLVRTLAMLDPTPIATALPAGQEPYLTLWNAWHNHSLFPYQASGAVLLLALYMNTLPQEA